MEEFKILIPFIILCVGILGKWISSSRAKSNRRYLFRENLKNLIADTNKQIEHCKKFIDQAGKDNSLSYYNLEMSALYNLVSNQNDEIFNAYFSGARSSIYSLYRYKQRVKGYSLIWNAINNIKINFE